MTSPHSSRAGHHPVVDDLDGRVPLGDGGQRRRAGTSAAPGVELEGVGVERDGRTILAALTLTVAPGMWLGIVGPNGAGKSTLLRALASVVRHTGSVRVGGRDLARIGPRDRARHVALIPQHPTMPQGTAVRDYVMLGRTPHVPLLGTELAIDRRVVDEILDRLRLTELTHRDLSTLSGGERQRAVIARALAQQAPVLLMDEPTTALDLGHQQHALELVDDLRRERGLTVVSAMHDLTLAAQHADRFVLLHHGQVVATGPAAEVFEPDTLRRVFGAQVAVLHDGEDLVIVPRRQRSWRQ